MPREKSALKPKAAALLAWYDKHRRRLPWRSPPGKTADPYAVWLSEIMLQQTTVTAVKPYFEAFLKRWPSVEKLAAAKVETVMAAWAGLGYYARTRNLHKCAGVVARELGVVDGNVERVMARVFKVTAPLPKSKPELTDLAAKLTPKARAGDYAQAVMDLGATICTPKSPRCDLCPWARNCAGLAAGIAETLPRKLPKTARPVRAGQAFWMVRSDGCVLLRRRPNRGLLGGMTEIPCSNWDSKAAVVPQNTAFARQNAPFALSNADFARKIPQKLRWKQIPGIISHTFTHFHLELTVVSANLTSAQARQLDGPEAIWTPVDKIGAAGLPSLMRKVAEHAIKETGL